MRIRQIGDPILLEVSVPIDLGRIGDQEISQLINRMKEILDGIKSISNENGNALSAPQVGSLVRLIVLRIEGVFQVMINPVFTPLSEKTFDFEEECFSLYDQRATLKRYCQGDVSYIDEQGKQRILRLSGDEAGLVQHEIDHLDGVLFLDRLEQQGGRAESIDQLLRDQPARLAQARALMDYMIGST